MRRVILAFVLFLPFTVAADGTLYVSPEHGTYNTGDVFQARVLADTGGQSINAAEAELDFDPRALSVSSVSTVGSILNSWSTQPSYSNVDGTIAFSGWAEQKYTGKNGLLVTITFKALRSMSGNARFAAGAILAADGQESNIISNMHSASFTIRGSVPQVAAAPSTPSKQVRQVQTQEAVSTREVNVPVDDGFVKPDPPSLAEYPRTAHLGERLYLKGTSDPDMPIKVFLQYGDNSPETRLAMSAADGTFTFASDEISRPGM